MTGVGTILEYQRRAIWCLSMRSSGRAEMFSFPSLHLITLESVVMAVDILFGSSNHAQEASLR